MTWRAPSHLTVLLSGVLLVSLTVTATPADAGLFDKVKAATSRLASVPLITAIGDYTKDVMDKGTALVKEGVSGTVDARTYNRRADAYFDETVGMGVKSFLQDAADNLKLKVANPLEGLKEKLGDTRLGQLASRVTEKLQGTTDADPATSVVKPNEPYGTIDPRLALDINEEETEWYRDETGIMDETSLSVAYLKGEIDSLDDALDSSQQEVAYQDEAGWADPTDVAHRADETQEGWSDPDDSADEWEDTSTPEYCQNAWIDIDAVSECGDGYQGDSSQSEETDVASKFDESQGGTYQEALDRLVGEDTESYADAYSGSDGGYEGALAQLEAEAAERERQAQLEAEAAERERQAKLAAATAERERRARLAAKEAEHKRVKQEQARQKQKEEEYLALREQLRWEEEQSRREANRDVTSGFLGGLNNLTNAIQQRSNAAYSAMLQEQARAAQEQLRLEERREWERRQAQNSRGLPNFGGSSSRRNRSSSGNTGGSGCPWDSGGPGSGSGSKTIC